VKKFLSFRAKHLESRPAAVRPLSKELAARVAALVKGSKVDLDAPIDGDVDL